MLRTVKNDLVIVFSCHIPNVLFLHDLTFLSLSIRTALRAYKAHMLQHTNGNGPLDLRFGGGGGEECLYVHTRNDSGGQSL